MVLFYFKYNIFKFVLFQTNSIKSDEHNCILLSFKMLKLLFYVTWVRYYPS